MTKFRKLSAILLSILLVVSVLPFYAVADSDDELTPDNIGEIRVDYDSDFIEIMFEDYWEFSIESGRLVTSDGTEADAYVDAHGNGLMIFAFDIDYGTYTIVLEGVEAEYYDGFRRADKIELTCTINPDDTVEISFGPEKPVTSVTVDGFTVIISVTNYNSFTENDNTVYTLTTAGHESVAITGSISGNQLSFDLSSFSHQYGEAKITVNKIDFVGGKNGDNLMNNISATFYINNNNTFSTNYYNPFTQAGTQSDPFIVTEQTLPYLSNFCANNLGGSTIRYYRLACDIDNVSKSFAYIISNAVFDGDGHIVTMNYSDSSAMYLFHTVGANTVIKNLIIDGKVKSNFNACAIADENYGLIYNCSNFADISTANSGAACAMVAGNYGRVVNCDNHGSLTAPDRIAGIVSLCEVIKMHCGSVENCFAACGVSGSSHVGGIVQLEYYDGQVASKGVINHCYYDSELMGGNIIGANGSHIDVIDSYGLSTYECKNGLLDELNSYVASSDIDDLAEWIVGPDGYPTLHIITKFPAEEHNFSTDWSYDKDAHWHECTDEDCSIEDYAACDLSGAAYGEHVDVDEDGLCDVCNIGWIKSTTTVLKSGKWIVDSNVFCFDTLTVDGDIEIYLEDMCTLNALGGIVVPANCKLTVNAESANSDCGSLIAMGKPGAAGIGGTADDEETVEIEGGCGTIIINGGKINAIGGSGAAGIGGGYASESGSVTVNDAVLLQATGYVAIGAGENAPDLCSITINTDLAVEAGENQYDITALTYTDEAYVRITNVHGTDYICGIADVSCGFEGEVEVTITDVSDGSIVYEGSTDGSNVYYIDGTVAEGTYLLEASSYDAVTRTYTVTVGSGKELAEVELYTEGDVNGDGEIDEYDYQQTVNIALSGDNTLSKTSDLSDDADYSLAVADADSDGVVDVFDISTVERKIHA